MKDPLKLVDVFRLDWETQQHPTFQLLVLSVISKKKKLLVLSHHLNFLCEALIFQSCDLVHSGRIPIWFC